MIVCRSRLSIPKKVRNRPGRPEIGKKFQAVFDSLPAHIAVLGATGTILAVNAAWRHFAESNNYVGAGHGVGINYLEICRQAAGSADARAAERAIRAVITPEQVEYCYEYPCHGPNQQRWFRAARFAGDGPIRVIVSHEEITALRDITSRLQVRDGRERLHELSRRLVAAPELERRQIAGDLHDQIGQNLAVLLEEMAR